MEDLSNSSFLSPHRLCRATNFSSSQTYANYQILPPVSNCPCSRWNIESRRKHVHQPRMLDRPQDLCSHFVYIEKRPPGPHTVHLARFTTPIDFIFTSQAPWLPRKIADAFQPVYMRCLLCLSCTC